MITEVQEQIDKLKGQKKVVIDEIHKLLKGKNLQGLSSQEQSLFEDALEHSEVIIRDLDDLSKNKV